MGFYYRGGLRAVCFTALARLRDGLSEPFPDSPGTRIIDIAFPLNDAFDPLLWCGQQPQWPQFYWQQRNGDEELAALGAVKLSSLDAANRFLHRAGRQDLRICGLNAFAPQQGRLVLPRLEWRRCGGRAVMRLVLHSDLSLRDDAVTARDFLASLTTAQRPRRRAAAAERAPLLRLSPVAGNDRPATQAIAAGDMDKVVLARATDLQFAAPLDAVSIMAASRSRNLNCFHFLMAFNARQAFFGSTPERLWRRRGALLRTEALAGTVANHQDDAKAQQLADWLMKDDKNQRENMLVVEDICQRLQSEASTLDVLPPQVVRLQGAASPTLHLDRAGGA